MMSRVDRTGRGARVVGLIFGLAMLVGWMAPAAGTVFDVPPTIGDRRVLLTWQPDPDDPIYNGNTVLHVGTRFTSIHGSGRSVRQIVSIGDGSVAYSFAEGENAIRGWRTSDGLPLSDLPLGPTALAPTALSLHASDRLLLGALPTGDFAEWRLDRPGAPRLVPGPGPVRALLCFPGVTDTTTIPLVTAGVDDTVRIWRNPGELFGTGYSIPIPGGTTRALDVSSDRKLVAVGTQDGQVRVYDIQTPPASPLLRLVGHAAPVTGVVFARSRGKLASVDSTGQVRIWKMPEGTLLATVESGSAAAFVGLSPPDGRILFIMKRDGTLEMRNGDTGDLYRSAPILGSSGLHVTVAALTADGIRILAGDDDGGITVVRAGPCRPGPDQESCFGGYMVWRSPTPNIEDRRLFRIYNYADSTWTFVGGGRSFCDPDSIIKRKNPPVPGQEPVVDEIVLAGPHNGVPNFYTITRFDLRFLDGGIFQVFPDSSHAVWNGFYRDVPCRSPDEPCGPPTPLVSEAPARPDSLPPLLGQVIVVPNPYEMGKVPWELAGEPHVEFRNLPSQATIRIYTVAGDLVRVIDHGPGPHQESTDTASWNLQNSAGRRVTSGVYVYQAETPAKVATGGVHLPGEVVQGFFTVVF